MAERLGPRDHSEAVALFRAQVVGELAAQQLKRGQLRAELRRLSGIRFRPPGASCTRYYGASTLERWYYRLRSGGVEALRPTGRSDRGHARALNDEQRELLVAIKRENPRASADLILRTLELDGRLPKGAVSAPTVRRLFGENGLDRASIRVEAGGRARMRWEAAAPGVLWHSDVCHGPALRAGGRSVPLRIHAILDDASRYVVAIQACDNERESEMLSLTAKALQAHGRPKTLYLDNGSTYSGEMLATACGRLGINLRHARPYDPEARGKMERFWRTLRAGCLDHIGTQCSLMDVQLRLLSWLDQHYHRAAHAGLMGRSPEQAFASNPGQAVGEDELREALTARGRRRVRRDGTLSVGGVDWEVEQGYLAGRLVYVGRSLLEPTERPWIEHDERRSTLKPVDAKANAQRPRKPFKPKPGIDAVPFDPAGVLLDAQLGRGPRKGGAR